MNNDTPADAITLLPCPFCGGRAIGTRTLAGVEFWSVECMTCTAKVDDPNSKQDAAKVWNRRTTSLAAQDGNTEQIVRGIIAKHYPDYKDSYQGRRLTIGMEAYAKGWHDGLHDRDVMNKEEDAFRAAQDGLVEALRKALNLAVMTLAFIGRDQGTTRIEATLDGMCELAKEADPIIRAALASIEVKSS